MRTDTRFSIPSTHEGRFVVSLPTSFEVLRVSVSHDRPCVWFLFDRDSTKHEEDFIVVKSGTSVPDNAQHIGSYSITHGTQIFHVYWLMKEGG